MKFKHRGYTLSQAEEVNHHYMILNPEGRRIIHVAYDGDLFTQERAEKEINDWLDVLIPMLKGREVENEKE